MASAAAQEWIDKVGGEKDRDNAIVQLNLEYTTLGRTPEEKVAINEAIVALGGEPFEAATPGGATAAPGGAAPKEDETPGEKAARIKANLVAVAEAATAGFNTSAVRVDQDSEILGGLPQTVDPTGRYATTYEPPMYHKGQSITRSADRPFDPANPNFGGAGASGVTDWYRRKDIFGPLSKPETIPDIQDKMIAAGLYDNPDAIRRGLWTALDQNAYLVALGYANTQGVDIGTALDMLEQHPAMPTIQLSSAMDVGAIADSVIPNVIGRKLSQAEKNKLVNAWHKVQSDFAGQTPQAGGVEEAAPSLDAFAEQWAEQTHPGDSGRVKTQNTFAKLRASLGRI